MRRFHQLVASLLLVTPAFAGCGDPSAPTPVSSDTALATTPPPSSSAVEGVLFSGGAVTGGAVTIPDAAMAVGAESASGVKTDAVAPRRLYFAVAVSGGFNRNDAYGWAYGTNVQGVINTSLRNCESYARGPCGSDQFCAPPQLSASRPYVAFARSSVFSRAFLDRGVSGFACGQTSLAAAVNYAVSQCRIHGCTRALVSGAIR